MNSPTDTSAPLPDSVGAAIKQAREEADLGVRELARQAGISHTQISRVESGEVAKPSRDVLVSTAKALDRNPIPLLIMAGHYDLEEAKSALRPMFREEAELPQVWVDWPTSTVDEVNELIRSPEATLDEVRHIAAEVFSVAESDETLWDDSYQLATARGENARQLQDFMAIWRFLTPDLRTRWLETGQKLRELADIEYGIENDQMEARFRRQTNQSQARLEEFQSRLEELNPEAAEELRIRLQETDEETTT